MIYIGFIYAIYMAIDSYIHNIGLDVVNLNFYFKK